MARGFFPRRKHRDPFEGAPPEILELRNMLSAVQLSAIQTSDPTTQAAINDVVTALTTTADAVDAGVAANPQTPNLAASPAS